MRLVVVGEGGHGRVVVEAAAAAGFQVVAQASAAGAAEVRALLERNGTSALAVAVGDNSVRANISAWAISAGAQLPVVVHPFSHVAPTAMIEAGSVILAGAVVGPGVRIGRGCIVNARAGVDHGCVLEDFAAVAPGATLGGDVHVGERSWIGLGASILEGRRIGADVVVGAGAVVVDDIPPLVVAFGVPCRVVRPRTATEPYL